MDEEEDDAIGIPEWVVTFGDMMSLLLTFFIMLVSLSEIKEEEKYQAMVDSMHQRFGYDASAASLAPGNSRPRNSSLAKLATNGRSNKKGTEQGGDKVPAPVGENPRVLIIRQGETTGIGTVVKFEANSVELSKTGKANLQRLGKQIAGKPQQIEVRGHTSHIPLPPDSEFNSHWDLAFRRSKVVMRFLADEAGIEIDRIRLGVAADNEPLEISGTPPTRIADDRVEVYMLDSMAVAPN